MKNRNSIFNSDVGEGHNLNQEIYDIVSDTRISAPHVVILGAGASKAAFLHGDRNGKKLPLMDDLVSVCGLEPIIQKSGIERLNCNFETLYSELYEKGNNDLIQELETTVFNYFSSLELPDHPTQYDLLVVSLRPKDLIATFNWDPLLWQARERNKNWAPVPEVLFLHGNTAVGYCPVHLALESRNKSYSKCGQFIEKMKLLYPIKKKNYNQDPYIAASWPKLKNYLKHAYILSIFGYSAPKSDVDAISLLREGWGEANEREQEQIEFIDKKERDELYETWKPFIFTHHFERTDKFIDSIIARHPRRSCEATWQKFLMCNPQFEYPVSLSQSWDELQRFLLPLIAAESK